MAEKLLPAVFEQVEISAAGRPVFEEDEIEIRSEDMVSVLIQENKTVKREIFPAGFVFLTNFRMIHVHRNPAGSGYSANSIHLRHVSTVEDCSKFMGTSTRIRIVFSQHSLEIGFKFHNTGKIEFITHVHKTLAKKSWEAVQKVKAPAARVGFSVSHAGVGGIIRRQEQSMEKVDKLASTAAADLDGLMKRAKEAVTIIQRYAAYSETRAASADDSKTEAMQEISEMEEIMQNIGIVSPVTKYSAGRQFHQQLARQIAEILFQKQRLERLGGMITLTDLYCLVNRARGTELVSPDDLLQSAEMLSSLQLGLQLHRFPTSGVKVVRATNWNEDKMMTEIVQLLHREEYSASGIQATDLSKKLQISLTIAREQLLQAVIIEIFR